MEAIAGLFALLFGLAWMVLFVALVVAFVHGLILTFRASIVLGIVCFFLGVPYCLFAVVYWFTRVDLAQRIVDFFTQNTR